ncbi:MAG: 30S ribosomal protein S14 [Phycisphaerales bacterium]|nr:30S ribosomal protein S14 [Phycisphaerales bacterium]
MAKTRQTPKYMTRTVRRCELTGRSRGVYRKFRISRIMLRKLALEGKIPGMRKASW